MKYAEVRITFAIPLVMMIIAAIILQGCIVGVPRHASCISSEARAIYKSGSQEEYQAIVHGNPTLWEVCTKWECGKGYYEYRGACIHSAEEQKRIDEKQNEVKRNTQREKR